MTIEAGAIEPGSTEYGDRQTLEEGLSEVSGAGGPSLPGSGAAATPEGTIPASPENPLSALLSGEIEAPGDEPLTSGLTVGPGPGPGGPASPTDNELGTKLKMIAEQSTSPTLRRLAVARLRRMYRGVDNAD